MSRAFHAFSQPYGIFAYRILLIIVVFYQRIKVFFKATEIGGIIRPTALKGASKNHQMDNWIILTWMY